jgi:hypothetical protein
VNADTRKQKEQENGKKNLYACFVTPRGVERKKKNVILKEKRRKNNLGKRKMKT